MLQKSKSELGKLTELPGEGRCSGKATGDETGANGEGADGQESASLRRKGDKEKIQFVKKQFSTVPAQVLTEGMHLFNNQDMSHYRK